MVYARRPHFRMHSPIWAKFFSTGEDGHRGKRKKLVHVRLYCSNCFLHFSSVWTVSTNFLPPFFNFCLTEVEISTLENQNRFHGRKLITTLANYNIIKFFYYRIILLLNHLKNDVFASWQACMQSIRNSIILPTLIQRKFLYSEAYLWFRIFMYLVLLLYLHKALYYSVWKLNRFIGLKSS